MDFPRSEYCAEHCQFSIEVGVPEHPCADKCAYFSHPGAWGDGHGLADDIPVLPVVLCALGFGCGGTPKSGGGEGTMKGPATCANRPRLTDETWMRGPDND